MKRQAMVLGLVVALGAILAGCASTETKEDATPQPISRGKVVAVNLEQNSVVLAHEEIPGVMMAMTMPFPVADPEMLEDLAVGDAIEFEVEMRQGQGLTVVKYKKIDPAELDDSARTSFEGEAEVIAVNVAVATILVRAIDIPGISGDGGLVYAVKPPSLLDGISDGDKVEIKLEDDGNAQGQLVVTHLKKIE